MSSDKMSGYFAFDINGLGYVMEKLGLVKNINKTESLKSSTVIAHYLPE